MAVPGVQLAIHLSRHHKETPLLDRQNAETVAKTLDLAPLGQLPYLKGPREPLLGLETHLNGRFCLKCLPNEAKNPGIFPNRTGMNTHLRNIHNIHRPKEVGNPKLKAISPIGVFWREGIAY